jgi:hypothetical protein
MRGKFDQDPVLRRLADVLQNAYNNATLEVLEEIASRVGISELNGLRSHHALPVAACSSFSAGSPFFEIAFCSCDSITLPAHHKRGLAHRAKMKTIFAFVTSYLR